MWKTFTGFLPASMMRTEEAEDARRRNHLATRIEAEATGE
jgi:hypothetical protein